MAVQQVIQVGAINVVLHPHPDGIYERLLRAAYKSRQVAQVYSDRSGIISQLYTVKEQGEVVALEGVISTFTKFDPSLPWFNAKTADDASDDDLGALEVPDYLMPNHRKCQFYFDTRGHLFLFETTSRKGGVAPRSMLKFLQGILWTPGLITNFGMVRLTVVPDAKTLDEVVDWKQIRTLKLQAHRPNPDYDEDDLREFEESLDDQNAEALELKLSAQPNSFLEPSERTRILAAIAADNGYVEAHGLDPLGRREVRSTRERKPLCEIEYFDPETENSWDVFKRFAQSVAQDIRRRWRRRPARRAEADGNN
ncbi:DUF4747 family protein [Xanthomonas sp. 3498]|uniref:DUF4747 family protein n=1 Tax=Xanthomonas sp. 3498 TaxID=2663863 RepID=UPI001618A478|nr:DUF4747 family protein [Xanthomonas sp. 3498]MBB5878212.1 hypothetical protein [Xanthomonas sp. 3498]